METSKKMHDQGKSPIPQGKSDYVNMDSSPPLFFKAGEMIIKEGSHSSCAYRILEGTVEVLRERPEGTVRLAKLSEGSIFGEMSLIEQMPYSATIKAVTDVQLFRIDAGTYTQAISQASFILKELIVLFSKRLRTADQALVILSEAERHHRQFSALSQKELSLVSHVANTGIQLQNVFEWNDAFKIISESLNAIGFKTLDLQIGTGKTGSSDLVDLLEKEKKGDLYKIHFHGTNRSGTLIVQTPSGKRLKDRYQGILMLYNGLLSSCLAKSETYEAFKNISEYVEKYMSDMRIQEIANTLRETIEIFSTRNLDIIMSIPEWLSNGKRIEDIALELAVGFQEIDRFAQEIDLIQKVLANMLNIVKGQLPIHVNDFDRNIDKIGDQAAIDTIFSD